MRILNVSEKNKVFTWTPPHTASRLAWKILDNFDFSSYDVDEGMKLVQHNFNHNHYIILPNNHNDYKLILTCRNPYFSSSSGLDGENIQERFSYAMETQFLNLYHKNFISNLKLRKPDYFVRVEILLEDYLKIPFIRESEFYKSGEMERLINNNSFKNTVYHNRPVLDKRLADLIYYNNIYYFELLGYHKDSWKS